jgi:hypothetical protein
MMIGFGQPRNNCLEYVLEKKNDARLVTKEEFDQFLDDQQFSDGPFIDSFGNGHGEPYNPYRQAYGQLKSGEVIFSELHHQVIEKLKI